MTGLYTENDNNKKEEEEEDEFELLLQFTVHREYVFVLWRVEEFKQLTEKMHVQCIGVFEKI